MDYLKNIMSDALGTLTRDGGNLTSVDSRGRATVHFGSISLALGWVNSYELHETCSLAHPLRNFTHPVDLHVQMFRPSLLGYENSGYVVTSVIKTPSIARDEWVVLAQRPGKPEIMEYVTWKCHLGDTPEHSGYVFYWGHYFKEHENAIRDLASRAGIPDVSDPTSLSL